MGLRMSFAVLGTVVLGTALAAAGAGEEKQAMELKVGDRAPGFELPGSDGKTYTLKQYAGKAAVVLAWYPKAMTGG